MRRNSFFLSGQTKEVGFRIQMLKKLRDAVNRPFNDRKLSLLKKLM